MVKSVARHILAKFEVYVLVLSALGALVSSSVGVSTFKALLIPIQATVSAIAIGLVRDRITKSDADATLQDLSALMRARASQFLFADQDEPYRRLEEYIRANQITEVIFIQYSGEQCKNLVSMVLSRGARVELYTQLPDTAKKIGSAMQADRIEGQFRNSFSSWIGDLAVFQCVPPVSVRAVRIDDKVLCVGPYTFEPEEGRPTYPKDTTAVSGHDRPTFFVQSGSPEYQILNGMFNDVLKKYRDSPKTKRVRL